LVGVAVPCVTFAEIKKNSKDQWVLFGYDNANGYTIDVIARGSGGLEDVSKTLKPDAVNFFVLGVVVPDDDPVEGKKEYSVVKNIFVIWVGPSVKPTVKAKSSQDRLALSKFVNRHIPIHGELQASAGIEEVNLKDILDKLRGARTQTEGLQSNLKFAAVKKGDGEKKEKVLAAEVKVNFADENDAKAQLEDLRLDSTPTNWIAFGYKDNFSISVIGKGSGGLAEYVSTQLKDDEPNFAILRFSVKEGDDKYAVVKNILIAWIGKNVKPTTKAKSSQDKVLLYNYSNKFLGLHGEFQAHLREDITEEALKEKLSSSRQKAQTSS